MERDEIRQVPYGVSDFMSVREEGLYYVDKTMYLLLLEALRQGTRLHKIILQFAGWDLVKMEEV